MALVQLAYLISSILFVWGLKLLSSPSTAKRGNLLAATGMGIAIITALVQPIDHSALPNNYTWLLIGMGIGAAIGAVVARRVAMTAMPQMVSIFNGLGGAAAVCLAMIEMLFLTSASSGGLAITLFTLVVGSISFTGSILAYLKLDGRVKDKNITFKGQQWLNLFVLVVIVCSIWIYAFVPSAQSTGLAWTILIISLLYGWSFVAPIGGADMPVVISLLNSLTGLSAATAGIIYDSLIMILGGILVGASGLVLTIIMCRAMNRSLMSVILGNFGSTAVSGGGGSDDQTVKEVMPSDLAIQLFYAHQIIIVPGYGLAVAQAQKICQELDALLSDNGVSVFYGIHPVAGRMPGHMNVLLAEANVSYDKLLSLEDANDKMPDTDVAIVVGANDVVNPAAEEDPSSPIYGMPVIQVWKAKNTVVLKRSMSTGYAGIQNPLFFRENNKMLFGDAKDSLQELVNEVKSLE